MHSVKFGGVSIVVSVDKRLNSRIRRFLPGGHTRSAANGSAGQKAHSGVLSASPAADPRLVEAASRIDWYHTLEFGGIVTRGAFDHRPILSSYPLPENLKGKRVLDVATFDGYWAFEFERRGASEVVAIDLEHFGQLDLAEPIRRRLPPERLEGRKTGAGFRLAAEALGSRVRRETISVYDLTPERVGHFDFVYVSSLLLHLKCPVKALERVRGVTKGEAMIVDCFDPRIPAGMIFAAEPNELCVWWNFSLEALEQMIRTAGFDNVEMLTRFPIGHRGERANIWHAAFRAS
jgi:tRNA (mo5U34)-methyltransferase